MPGEGTAGGYSVSREPWESGSPEGPAAQREPRAPGPTAARPGGAASSRLEAPGEGPEKVPVTLSVVLPIFNQSQSAAAVFEVVRRYAEERPGHQFVFVDDGSTDGTGRILQEQMRRAKGRAVSVIARPRNGGKGFAVKTGVARCEGDLICFLDGDLAYSLDHLPALAEALRVHDVAIGSRNLNGRRQQNIHPRRRVLGWAFNRLARLLLRLPYRDTQAGLKGFRRGAARHLFGLQRIHGFAFDAELLFLARRYGYRLVEIPAVVSDSHSYKLAKIHLLRDSLRMLCELVQIRWGSLRGAYDRRALAPPTAKVPDLPEDPRRPRQGSAPSWSG